MGVDLNIIIGADNTELQNVLSDSERRVEQFVKQVESIGKVGEQLQSLGTKLTLGLTVPIIALSTASVKAYGDLQALELGIKAVAGSASFAAKQMESLREIAKLPGLGLNEAAKGSVGLQAIGYSAGNAEKILMQFGNAIATVGKGRVEFERAIYGVQQLANTDFPLGEDLNIIKDALPQVSALLKAAFGTSRTEDLQNLKVSSKEVMDVILAGLEKLPRVSGGIKNAFENLKDSMQQNLARIGELIDKNLDISGVINKITSLIDKAISKFEGLSKPVQELTLIFIGLTAATGPILLGIGGLLALLPSLVNGFNAARTAIIAFNTAMLTNPYLAAGAAILSLAAAFGIYRASIETTSDRLDRWNDSLAESRSNARIEISNLEILYKKTQDHSVAIEERNSAVDQIQKEYPHYFGNLTNEAVLAGQAAGKYKELRSAILNASLARAAQKELDTRAEASLKREVEVRKKLTALFQIQKINNSESIKGFVKDYENALTTTEKLLGGVANPFANSAFQSDSELKVIAKQAAKNLLNSFTSELRSSNLENKPLLDVLKRGAEDIKNLDISAPDNFLPGLDKVKKETEKQLAEIFPKGSIAELQQRADLLKKSIETSVNDIVKVRGLDKFGKETNKKGLPYFTGELISLNDAKERFEQLSSQISLLQIKPPEGVTDFKSFREKFTDELIQLSNATTNFDFNLGSNVNPFENITNGIDSLSDSIGKVENFKSSISSNLQQLGTDVPLYLGQIANSFLVLPKNIGLGIDSTKVKVEGLKKIAEDLNKDFENLINSSISNGLTNMFSSIGEAIGTGGDVIGAVGNSLLNLFASFLSDMGSMLIKYGTLAIMKGTLDLIIQTGGYQAIAAGVAAIAVGAALSIAGGALGKRSTAGMSGGGSTSTGSTTGLNNNYSSSYSSGGGGSLNGEVVFRISGNDLVGVLNRTSGSINRLNAG